MKRFVTSLIAFTLFTGLFSVPNAVAQNNKVGTEATTKHKQTNGPFHGRLKAVNKTAKTITIGTRTFHITPQTRILRADKPATLDDAVVGEETSGGFKTAENGQLVATKVNLGPKVDPRKTDKK